jgi:membrane associated rhomboid family serine protease
MRIVVVPILLALNLVVFISWLMVGQSQFMLENFLVSWSALESGRWWTLVTSEFSHLWFVHIFLNMFVLMNFGPIVEMTIGSARFVVFYLLAAVVSSISHAAVSNYLLHQPDLPALGASGAISGVVLLFALLYPRATLLLFGIIPMPALIGVLAFVGLDVIGLIAQTEGSGLPIGHGAHLGGAATGFLYYLFVIRGLGLRRPQPIDFGKVATWRQLIAQNPPPEYDRHLR